MVVVLNGLLAACPGTPIAVLLPFDGAQGANLQVGGHPPTRPPQLPLARYLCVCVCISLPWPSCRPPLRGATTPPSATSSARRASTTRCVGRGERVGLVRVVVVGHCLPPHPLTSDPGWQPAPDRPKRRGAHRPAGGRRRATVAAIGPIWQHQMRASWPLACGRHAAMQLSQFPAPRGEVVELKQRSTWSRVGVLESQLPVRIVELCGANATVSSPPCEGCVPLVVHKRCVSSITGMSCRRSSPLE